MDRLLNQFRRIYSDDDGRGNIDFTEMESALQAAKERLAAHTQELVRAAENLNRAAIEAGAQTGFKH